MLKHIQRINRGGKAHKYHRFTRAALPSDVPEDHPDFLAAYAAASQIKPIKIDKGRYRFAVQDSDGCYVRHRSGLKIPCPPSALISDRTFSNFYREALSREIADRDISMQAFARVGLRRARERAKKKAVAFDIDEMFVLGLLQSQTYRCAISGIEFSSALPIKGRTNPLQPSLDRSKPEAGYVRGNVSWVLHAVNCGKGEMPLRDYLAICKAVSEAQEQNGTQ